MLLFVCEEFAMNLDFSCPVIVRDILREPDDNRKLCPGPGGLLEVCEDEEEGTTKGDDTKGSTSAVWEDRFLLISKTEIPSTISGDDDMRKCPGKCLYLE